MVSGASCYHSSAANGTDSDMDTPSFVYLNTNNSNNTITSSTLPSRSRSHMTRNSTLSTARPHWDTRHLRIQSIHLLIAATLLSPPHSPTPKLDDTNYTTRHSLSLSPICGGSRIYALSGTERLFEE
ncbi:unnamed protein product [Absidia cylindrospora]